VSNTKQQSLTSMAKSIQG